MSEAEVYDITNIILKKLDIYILFLENKLDQIIGMIGTDPKIVEILSEKICYCYTICYSSLGEMIMNRCLKEINSKMNINIFDRINT